MDLNAVATVVAKMIAENNKQIAQSVADLKVELHLQKEKVAELLDQNKQALEAIDRKLTGENKALRAELEELTNLTATVAEDAAKGIDATLTRVEQVAQQQRNVIDLDAAVEQVSARFEKRFCDHLIHHERKANDTLADAVKNMPKPQDALPVDSFDLDLAEDGRTLSVSLKCAEQVVTKQVRMPTVLYKGVYKDGREYEPQDSVTVGGCLWIANCKTSKRPGDDNRDWQMAVKKGRDGIDLRENASTHDPSKPVRI